jgi:hypothetical protein
MSPDSPRTRPFDLAVAFGVGVLAFAVMMPWPRPSLSLRGGCALDEAGRFGATCDVGALAERLHRPWLRQNVRVYEDGIRLREAASAGEASRHYPGSYHTTGQVLTFSALDGSDPRANGRDYVVRSLSPSGPWGEEPGLRRGLAGAGLAVALAVLAARRRERARPLLGASALAVALAGLVVQVVCVLKESPVHVDTGYALATAEAVNAGAVPYRTVLYHYAPLGLYEYALWGRLWPGSSPAPLEHHLALVILNELGCAAVVYALLRRAGVATALAALAAVSMVSMMLWFDGARILLEPLYLFPVLVSAWIALAPRSLGGGLLSGVLAAAAMMTKQYGGFAAPALVLSAWTGERDRLKRSIAVAAGMAAGLVLVTLVMQAVGVSLLDLVHQVLGPKYGRRFETNWIPIFLRACPMAVLAPLVPFLPGAWSRPVVRVAACFGLASLLPFYFRQYQYYFLNLVPWVFLLVALGAWHLAERHATRRAAVELTAVLLLLTVPLRGAAFQSQYLSFEVRSEQLRRARMMTNAWPSHHKTLLLMTPGFTFVTHYPSPAPAEVGFRFPNEAGAEELRRAFENAEGVWIDANGMYARGTDRVLKEAGSSTADQLAKNGFERRTMIEDRLELWTKTWP